MKTTIALLVATLCANAQVLISDGTKPFPVVVQVFEEDGITPAKGADVSLIDLPTKDLRGIVLRDERRKAITESLEKPVSTDARGCAVLFFVGRFGDRIEDGKLVNYSQSLDGTLVVNYKGREILRVLLSRWARDNGYSPTGHDSPWITVVVGKDAPDKAQQAAPSNGDKPSN
jgi:hypothetical protein